jgi:hypothetical protein
MYFPIPFYNNNSEVSSGDWLIVLNPLASSVINVVFEIFPSMALKKGDTINYNGNKIIINDAVMNPDATLELYLTIEQTTQSTKEPLTAFANGLLDGFGITVGSYGIKSVTRLITDPISLILIYGTIAFIIYKLIK